jgi:hypothetical protein
MQLQLYDVTVGEARHGPVASYVSFASTVDIIENPAGLWGRGTGASIRYAQNIYLNH